MITILLRFWKVHVLAFGLYMNGLVLFRCGTGLNLAWTFFSLFFDQTDRSLSIQFLSKKPLRIGGRRVR